MVALALNAEMIWRKRSGQSQHTPGTPSAIWGCCQSGTRSMGHQGTHSSGVAANSANSVPEKFTARAGTIVEMACL